MQIGLDSGFDMAYRKHTFKTCLKKWRIGGIQDVTHQALFGGRKKKGMGFSTTATVIY
jgi:hypothetical protein